MDENYLVTKSNFFIMNSSYDLTLEEQKIILTLASMVQPTDEEFKAYTFKVSDFMKLLDIKTKTKYSELPKITKNLMKKVFEIKEDNRLIQLAWLSSVIYEKGSGEVILKFSPDLKPYMLKLNKLYTSYRLANILSMKSKYSPRIYEILKCNEFKKEKCIEIQLDLLKKLLKTEHIYPRYNDFKRFILVKAQKELDKLSDIRFEFEEVKTGRKVTSLRFYIESKDIESNEKDIIEIPKLIENSITVDAIEDMKPEDPKKNLIEENDEIIFLKNLFDNKLDNVECAKILAVAKGNLDMIKDAYNIALQQPKIKNLCGWIIACIKNDYTVPVAITNLNNTINSKVDSFNDFEQRDYDWPELEKKLLGWDTEEKKDIDEQEILINYLDELKESGIDGKTFYYYPINFDTNQIHGTLNGTLMAFKYKIENNGITLTNASTNEIISKKNE
ncbi:replication initiation protein [Clostridium novyi]|uniref:replication initiation protein n=1 Tax=Clostridium novyi TaxID=1542 RepID=UPI000907EFCB|nr:replication initiation protein [Clostridium novyi]